MQGISKQVTSSQSDVHQRLITVLDRYRNSPYRKPVAAHTREAFRQLMTVCQPESAMILDSGCGTAESSRLLSHRYPDHTIVAVDQSASRLSRAGLAEDQLILVQDNLILLRAEIMDLCRLLADDGIRFDRHYALYPNPWPKPGHLQRRYHAHPAFMSMLALAPWHELRTNWSVYAAEFAASIAHLTGTEAHSETFLPDEPVSAFERKYSDSDHPLHRVRVDGLKLQM